MKYKYILFDLDGTIIDPKEGITKSVQYALSKFNIIVDDLNELERFIGPPLIDSFADFYNFNKVQTTDAILYYREVFKEKGIYQNKLYDNIELLLKTLKDSGLKLFIATSKPTVFAETILKHFHLDNYFEAIIGSNLDNTRSKKAEVVKYILDNYNINSTEAIMIGDRKHDIVGAKENNLDSIGVLYGYGSIEEFSEFNATHIVSRVMDILDVLSA